MKERVKEWIERGERDLAAAELLFDQSEYFDVVLFHLHQAVEKFLKGFLIHSGWRLKKIHDLETLITEAIDFDGAFEKYLDLARKLTAFYYQERYPPGPVSLYSKEETAQILEETKELISKIRRGIEGPLSG